MRINIEMIDSDFWNQQFQSMPIPGERDGIAVLREGCLEFSLVAIGREESACIEVKMSGDPLRILSRVLMTEDEFAARLCMLDPWPCDQGLIRTHNTLDGVGYLVKRLRDGRESRLIVCNPRLLGDTSLEEFANRLDAFLNAT
jgi:hypothetical protein